MRQVPHYLIIGNGRVARHFQHYFSLLSLSFDSWNRSQSLETLLQSLSAATHVLLLIHDKAIEDFIQLFLKNSHAMLIHFSGSLVTSRAYGAHPLMTFNETLYDLNQYQEIYFVIDHHAPAFADLLPGLTNPHVYLKTTLKEKYHALCVLSGNFSCLLWQKLFNTLEKEFQLPAEMAFPYVLQQARNLIANPSSALTGPLVRQDFNTIEKNLLSLADDPFQEVYKSFVSCYQTLAEEKIL